MLEEGSVLASQWWKTEVSWNASWILGYHRLMNRHSSTASRRCGNHFGMAVFLLSLERDSWTMKWWMWAFWAFCFIFTAVVEEAVSLLWIWILSLVTWLLQCLCLWRVVGGSLNHIVKPKDHLCQEWKENCVMPSSTSPQFLLTLLAEEGTQPRWISQKAEVNFKVKNQAHILVQGS